ncbi:MAG: PIN domain-containing protein [Actinomycetota bacterium]|nr:PIN domain-containing protein [Actinomycetota bacterium]
MPFIATFDANVLYPISLCDLFITTLESGLYRAHWSTEILAEVGRTYQRNFPEKDLSLIQRRIDLMNVAEPAALIDPPRELIDAMTNDPKDRHVLATAVAVGADVLVTFNLDDFPEDSCSPYGVEPQHPDEFVEHLVDLDPTAIWRSLEKMAGRRRNPPATPEDVRSYLAEHDLPGAMRLLAETERGRT